MPTEDHRKVRLLLEDGNVHHLESRKTGGDAPSNLITLCETCHEAYHAGLIELKVKRGQSYRDAAFMGIMRWAFYNQLKEIYPNVAMTFGYLTKHTRIHEGIEKSHATDAYCITGYIDATRTKEVYFQKFVRRNNRRLHKATILPGGVRKANQCAKVINGFRLFDKVLYNDTECFIFGKRTRGYFNLRLLDGTIVHTDANCKKLKLLETARTLLTERRRRIPPPPVEVGVSCA